MLLRAITLTTTLLQPLLTHGEEVPGTTDTIQITSAAPGDNTFISGAVKWVGNPAANTVVVLTILRRDGKRDPSIPPTPILPTSTFVTTFPLRLEAGDRVLAQLQSGSNPPGPFSPAFTVPELCANGSSGNFTSPTVYLSAEAEKDVQVTSTVSTLGDRKVGRVLLCGSDHLAIAELFSTDADTLTTRSYVQKHLTIPTGTEVYILAMASGNKDFVTSNPLQKVPAPNSTLGDYQVALVGGLEVGGYSSQAQNTNAFVQLYIDTPFHQYKKINQHLWVSDWLRVRLLGAASPTTSGIGSTFADPSGAITKQDFSTIGQALDYAAGLQIALRPESPTLGRYGFIAGAGATTPLSSNQTALTFKAPALSTSECGALISRFQLTQAGYAGGSAFVDPSTSKTSPQCLLSKDKSTAIKDIAFANQDRSNFLGKWGFGFRATGTQNCAKGRTNCADALALLDLTVGQDATLTGGKMRHFVVKLDGLLPIKTGDAAYLYLFGSAYTRLTRNVDQSPLILAAETNKPTLPDPSVIVLPFTQPDRDYYRLGIGLNLQQVFCKFGAVLCDTKAK